MNYTTPYENVLRPVPKEKAFYFFTDVGNYAGQSASSLKEFLEKMKEVNVKSLEFHVERGDFEKWVRGVLSDEELARQLKEIQKANAKGEDLRRRLSSVISLRLEYLARPPTQPRYTSTSKYRAR